MRSSDLALLANLFSAAVTLAVIGAFVVAFVLITGTPADWAQAIRGWIDARA